MVVGLSPHKPAAAGGPTSGDKGGAPALMDALMDLQPHETINHKTYQKGAWMDIWSLLWIGWDRAVPSVSRPPFWGKKGTGPIDLTAGGACPRHTHTPHNPTGKQVPEKTDDQRALIELALHQNSLFTCLDEEQISKCVRGQLCAWRVCMSRDTRTHIMDQLSELSISNSLTPRSMCDPYRSDRGRFVREARLLEFEPGEVIFAQGEKGYDCFIIDDGEAEILDQAEDGTLESILRRTVSLRRG